MSGWLGQNGVALLGICSLCGTDDRAVALAANYQWTFQPPRQAQSPWQDGQLWTSSTGLGGGLTGYGGLTQDAGTQGMKWELWGGAGWDDTGGQKMNVINGQTIDASGAPLGNVNVQGFVTATDVFVGQVTSDTAGGYRLPTPYSTGTTHYVVAYKAGSPDVAGTSVNTLTPTATG